MVEFPLYIESLEADGYHEINFVYSTLTASISQFNIFHRSH